MFEADYFLKKHNIVLDRTKSDTEQGRQMKTGFRVKSVDVGDRPYIFVSYSHKDSAVVLPAIKALQDEGYPVWYDDGLSAGIQWKNHIADRVSGATLVVAFMSKNANVSVNCLSEVEHAIDQHRPILPIMLDQTEMPSGLKMYLNSKQKFEAHSYDNGDKYIIDLVKESIIRDIMGAANKEYNEQKRQKELEAERDSLDQERIKLEAKLKSVNEKKLELERQIEVTEDEPVNSFELEKKCQEAEYALRQERERRGSLERELQNAKTRIKSLEDAVKKQDKVRPPLPKQRVEERELIELNEKVLEHLCKQTYSGYNKAIHICTNSFAAMDPVMQGMKEALCAMMYHDARVLEKKKLKKAYAIYHALSWVNRDARARKTKIEKAVIMRSQVYCIMLSLFYLMANFLMAGSCLNENATFLSFLLVHAGPLLVVMAVWLIFRWGWYEADEPLNCIETYHLMLSWIPPLIAMVVDPFLYPGEDAIIKLVISILNNALSATIVFFGSLFVLCFEDGLRKSITPIR